MMESGQVLIRKHGADRIRRGHVWVYRSDIISSRDAGPGSIVSVREDRGLVLGKAFYSSKSQIALRFLARGDVTIDEEFFRQRFAAADRLRDRLQVDPLLSRRVYSEADFLPGWIVDRYDDRLVVQSLIQSTDNLEPLITRILGDLYQPRSILFRNDSKVRELEGLELRQHVIGDPIPETILVNEDGKQIAVSVLGGQKTGAYLDQRDNHRAARRYVRGHALDAFTYAGGFAIHISEECEQVEAVDISGPGLELARANGERNGINNIRYIEANVFDFLRDREKQGARYDAIILDPPAFARTKDNVESALRGYKEINN